MAETLKTNENHSCDECQNKSSLIDKYVSLIDLLKRKMEKNKLDGSSRNTLSWDKSQGKFDVTDQTTKDLSECIGKYNSIMIIQKIFDNRKLHAFHSMKKQSVSTLPCLIINNITKKAILRYSFECIRMKHVTKKDTDHKRSLKKSEYDGSKANLECHESNLCKTLARKNFLLELQLQNANLKI